MKPSFVHLRTHSEYSLVNGLVKAKPLMQALPKRGMNAIAVTDMCNLFAAVKVFKAAISAGIKPILGADVPCIDPNEPTVHTSMVLLCQNETGYRNLLRLVSKAYQEGQYQGQPRVHYDWIKSHADGLIALSGGRLGDIGQALLGDEHDEAEARARQWRATFPDRFYLEIQRTNRPDEASYNQLVVALADKLQLPLVATNDVMFLNEDDYEAHEARVCIHDGFTLADTRRVRQYTPQQYLRSAAEMDELFSDLPQALQNTVEIAKRCTVKLALDKTFLPKFTTPEDTTPEQHLSILSAEGLKKRLVELVISENTEVYDARLQRELEVINDMGFASYFLIVADFIQWAKDNGVPVGPGRGSGAGSLVAYALGITDLDPLTYDLLFERFLNPERVSMPDFDIDFCMDGRDRVIDYVAQRYGRDAVSQIITFGTMAAKAVVRDVGRVLGHPYGFVDQIAKLIPFELGITLNGALEQEEELNRRYREEEDVKELIDLAMKLEGIARNAGKHAGGVVIAPSALTDFTPIYCEQDSTQLLSQFDKDDVEAVGLVKFDFLGLRTLTIIHSALARVNAVRQEQGLKAIDINAIPMNDAMVFDLLKAGETDAVFQLESRGMKEVILQLQPDSFEEIIALVALYRPGPLQSGMVDNFIARKHGLAPVEYLHFELKPILQATYGVILYQEQVMQIAQSLANYTLGGADLLRRAMGKKKPEEMAKQRKIFLEGAKDRGIEADVAETIFDLMEKFAGYGFNKSHSAAYALLAYQTAWLKAHYPAAFMAAVLSSDMDNTDKVVLMLREAKRMGLSILPPTINRSEYAFLALDDSKILYGLGAIKGVGSAALDCIFDARKDGGPFDGLFQFCHRVDSRRVNRRVLEALIKCGSFDEWGIERATLVLSLEKAMHVGAQMHKNSATGQTNLLSLLDQQDVEEGYLTCKPWSMAQCLAFEKETLGFYLSGHPADIYCKELQSFVCLMSDLGDKLEQKSVHVCGVIQQIKRIVTKRGKKLIIIRVEDATGSVDVVAFAELFEQQQESMALGKILVVEGEVSVDEYSKGYRMKALALYTIERARSSFARCLHLILGENDHDLVEPIKTTLSLHQGRCRVHIEYENKVAKAVMQLERRWSVQPNDALISQLEELIEPSRVMLCYG